MSITFKGHQISIAEKIRDSNSNFAIVVPGFLDTKDYDHLTRLTEVLFEKGFDVVSFDPVGTWESDGEISLYTVSNYMSQVKLIAEKYSSNKDYKNVIIAGHSLGGRVSVLAAAEVEADAVIAIMPPYSASRQDNREKILKWRKVGYRESKRDDPKSDGGVICFKTPSSFIDDAEKYDTLEIVHKLTCPILFVVGELDTAITPEDTKVFFERANEPKQMVVLENIEHGYRRSKNHIELVNNEVLKFLASHSLINILT